MIKIGVVGNEASDADSIVSAVVYAWFLNHTAKDGTEHIPFVQCEISDLSERLDFQEVCKISKTTIENVRSLSDHSVTVSHWILLDHHFPSKSLRVRADFKSVIEIIDHHEIVSEEAKQFVASVPKVDIRTIGSTCTIIAQLILKTMEGDTQVPEWILWLLFLVIMIDTCNLDPARGKTTQTDLDTYNLLKSRLNPASIPDIYQQLLDSIFSPEFWYNSSLERILSHDFKEMEGVGYSVLLRSISGISDEEIATFARKRGFKIYVISCGFHGENGKLRRQQLFYLPAANDIAEAVIAKTQALVNMKTIQPISEHKIVRLETFDDSFSRKKFFPLFLNILREYSLI